MSVVMLQTHPPRADEAEEAVLGAVIVRNPLLAEVASLLRPEHFGQAWAGTIYRAMLRLAQGNQPIDYLTLKAAIGDKAIEDIGFWRLSKLGEGVPSSTNIAYYADIVIDTARRRAAIEKAIGVIESALEPQADADDVLTRAQEAFFRLAQAKRGDTLWSADRMTDALWQRLEALDERKHGMSGLETGIHDLDAITNGLQPGELVVLGARPSVGKTGLALQLGLHAAKKTPVLFCSLEMGQAPVWDRAFFNVARLDGFRFKRGYYAGDPEAGTRIGNAISVLKPLPFWLDEQPGMSSVDVRAKAQQVLLRHGLGLVVVDYLQLMRPADPKAVREMNRSQIIGDMTRDLKEIARTLNVAVILLSQLRRLEDGKRPSMADLRESGDIEAHADIILLMHRVETRDQMAALPVGEPTHVELLVEKQRGNPTGMIRLLNFREQYRFASETRGDRDPHEDGTLFAHVERAS